MSFFIRVVLRRKSHSLINNKLSNVLLFINRHQHAHTHTPLTNMTPLDVCVGMNAIISASEHQTHRFTASLESIQILIILNTFFFLFLRFSFTLHMCDCMRIATHFFSSCFLIACDYVVTASFEISASQFECLRLRLTEFQYASEMVLLASILRFIFIRRSHLIRLSSCRSLRCRRRNRYYY